MGLFLLTPPCFAGELFRDNFDVADGLLTNEFAYWNPLFSSSKQSAVWEMTSGSLFVQGRTAWSGIPDDIAPNVDSSNGNNSAVFRLTSKSSNFGDVRVSFSLLNQGLSTTASTPAENWDGVHIFLRYLSEENLYYASINRRDNTVIIKKKIPGGPSNGGTYFEICRSAPFTVPYNTWQNVTAEIGTNSDHSVTIRLFESDRLLVSAIDDGTIGGPPITLPGKVGIRADNANIKFDNFSVATLIEPSAPTPPPSPTPSPNPSPIPAPIPAPIPNLELEVTEAPSIKRRNVFNRATGDRELTLYCDEGSPTIRNGRGMMVRENLPQVAENEYRWDGTSQAGQIPASGAYQEQCGKKVRLLVFIRG